MKDQLLITAWKGTYDNWGYMYHICVSRDICSDMIIDHRYIYYIMMVVSDLLVLFFVSSVSTKPAFSIGSTFYHNSDQLVVLKKKLGIGLLSTNNKDSVMNV